MASNNFKLKKKTLFQITLIFLGVLIIFFTYFYNQKQKPVPMETKKQPERIDQDIENISTFENIQYEGVDGNGNKFIINSTNAEFENQKPNIIYMKNIVCRFFFQDNTTLRITSNKGIFDNISNDMEFAEKVKMYYLENRLFSERATFVNSENYLLIQDNVVGEGPQGNLAADKLNIDLLDKKMKISMYNEDKVNIRVNY